VAKSKAPTLQPIHLPVPVELKLANGLTALSVERGAIPLVTAILVLPAGSALDVPGKEGLADFTAQLLRRGTARFTAEALEDEVELYGGNLGVQAAPDSMSVSISCPSEELGRMLRVMGSMVREPLFLEEEIAHAKRRTLGAIANDLDDPAALAERALNRALFGRHPYAHESVGRMKAVESFTRDDVVEFHRNAYGPAVASLILVGVVPPRAKLQVLLEEAFGDWKGGPVALKVFPVNEPAAAGVWLVNKEDQSQSQIRVGVQGPWKKDPRRIALLLLESVLGGGFTSRLVEEIRVNRGLSYSVRSEFDRLRSGGSFCVRTYTQTESTRELLQVLLGEVRKLRERGMPRGELEKAKRYLSGIFPARLESSEALAASFADMKMFDLPADHLTRYREKLWEAKLPWVNGVAKEVLFAEPPAIVVVGRAKDVLPQLKGFGEVRELTVAELQ